MAEVASERHGPTRAAALAAAAVVLVLFLALFVGSFLIPFLQTRAAVREYAGAGLVIRAAGPPPWRVAVERLGGPERAVKRLARYVRMPDWAAPDREAAIVLLGLCGEPAVPVLEEVLRKREELRIDAAAALGQVGPKASAAVSSLEEALRDKDADVRDAAASALGCIGPAAVDATPALERALGDESCSVQCAAAAALCSITGDTGKGLPVLIRVLGSGDTAEQRLSAAFSLGLLEPLAKVAVPALSKATKDEDERVRRVATWALERMQAEP